MLNTTLKISGTMANNLDILMNGTRNPMRGSPDLCATVRKVWPELNDGSLSIPSASEVREVEFTDAELKKIEEVMVTRAVAGSMTAVQLNAYKEIVETFSLQTPISVALDASAENLRVTTAALIS